MAELAAVVQVVPQIEHCYLYVLTFCPAKWPNFVKEKSNRQIRTLPKWRTPCDIPATFIIRQMLRLSPVQMRCALLLACSLAYIQQNAWFCVCRRLSPVGLFSSKCNRYKRKGVSSVVTLRIGHKGQSWEGGWSHSGLRDIFLSLVSVSDRSLTLEYLNKCCCLFKIKNTIKRTLVFFFPFFILPLIFKFLVLSGSL